MIDALGRLTESIRGKVQLMIGRAILSGINDAGAIQTVQAKLLADEVQDDAERVQQYGYSSVPLPGAEAVLAFVGGNRDHGLVIATDDRRYRKRGMQSGEVCVYTDEGDYIVLNRGRIIRVVAGTRLEVTAPVVTIQAATKVRMETPILEVTGEIKDKCDTTGRTMSGMRSIYNGHNHNETNAPGGSTQQPNQAM